jgi:hypothetical protein
MVLPAGRAIWLWRRQVVKRTGTRRECSDACGGGSLSGRECEYLKAVLTSHHPGDFPRIPCSESDNVPPFSEVPKLEWDSGFRNTKLSLFISSSLEMSVHSHPLRRGSAALRLPLQPSAFMQTNMRGRQKRSPCHKFLSWCEASYCSEVISSHRRSAGVTGHHWTVLADLPRKLKPTAHQTRQFWWRDPWNLLDHCMKTHPNVSDHSTVVSSRCCTHTQLHKGEPLRVCNSWN